MNPDLPESHPVALREELGHLFAGQLSEGFVQLALSDRGGGTLRGRRERPGGLADRARRRKRGRQPRMEEVTAGRDGDAVLA